MPHICAILPCQEMTSSVLECLNGLAKQIRLPDSVLLLATQPDSPPLPDEVQRLFSPGVLHCLRMAEEIPLEEAQGRCMDEAFGKLHADYVWALDSESRPLPTSLSRLVDPEACPQTIRINLMLADADDTRLSPILTTSQGKKLSTLRDLPAGKRIPCQGSWLGALYPRAAWQQAGTPSMTLFPPGDEEEYPWRIRQAGFRYEAVPEAPMRRHALPPLSCTYGKTSFFYEQGLPIDIAYSKARNRALLQRLQRPHAYMPRLLSCARFIILTLASMLRTGEFTPQRIYQLFRGQHNGFYGKARPYAPTRKNP